MQIDYRAKIDTRTGRNHVGFRVLPGRNPGDEIMLRPGVNTLRDDVWLELQKHKGVQELIATGQLRELGDVSIAAMAPYEVAELVERTTELATLRAWADQLAAERFTPIWQNVCTILDKQIEEASTDIHGKPAEPREVRFAATR